ncbi:MAG: tetratricopeptide repeat protein [bacterium]
MDEIKSRDRESLERKANDYLRRAIDYEKDGYVEMASLEYVHYADILWQIGSKEEAIRYYETADRLSPLSSHFRNNLGDMYFDLGDKKMAAREYAKVVSLYEEQGLLDSAIRLVRSFLEKLPGEIILRYELADLYLKSERTQRAVSEYQRIIDEAGEGDSVALSHSRLGDIYARRGTIREALYHYLKSADEYFKERDIGESARQLKNILKIKPDSIIARKRLIEMFALKRDKPSIIDELLILADILMKRGKREMALATYTKVREIDPTNTVAQKRLSEALRLATVEEATSGLSLDERMSKEVMSSLDSIIKELAEPQKEIVKDFLKDAETHYDLGIGYFEMDLYDDAIRELQMASRDPKLRAKACNMLGLCFTEKGEVEMAIREYLRGLRAVNDEQEELGLRYNLARAYEYIEQYEKALEQLIDIYVIDINFLDVREKIDLIKRKLAK